jgi:hypothetical protein
MSNNSLVDLIICAAAQAWKDATVKYWRLASVWCRALAASLCDEKHATPT